LKDHVLFINHQMKEIITFFIVFWKVQVNKKKVLFLIL